MVYMMAAFSQNKLGMERENLCDDFTKSITKP